MAIGICEDQLGLAGTGHAVLDVLVHVAVSVTGNGDGSPPALDHRLDALDHDGCAEDGAVEHRADGAVGALPHLVQVVLLHALGVGGDGCALDGNAQTLCGPGGVDGHLVVRLVPVLEAQVKVLGLEVDVRADELVLGSSRRRPSRRAGSSFRSSTCVPPAGCCYGPSLPLRPKPSLCGSSRRRPSRRAGSSFRSSTCVPPAGCCYGPSLPLRPKLSLWLQSSRPRLQDDFRGEPCGLVTAHYARTGIRARQRENRSPPVCARRHEFK